MYRIRFGCPVKPGSNPDSKNNSCRCTKTFPFKTIYHILLTALISTPVAALEVNLSGVTHLSVDRLDDGFTSSWYMASNSSRLNFNGSHAITPETKLLFQFESGMDLTGDGTNDGNGSNPDTTGGQVFTRARDSYVGIESLFGTLLLGHHSTGDTWFNEYNLFADQVGDIGNLWAGSGLPGRSDNVVYYLSPEISGLDLAISFIPDEGAENTDAVIIKPAFATDTLKFSLTYASFSQGVDLLGADLEDHEALSTTVSYDLGTFDFGVGYQQETNIGGIANNDRESWSVGGKIKIGSKLKFKAQYTQSTSDAIDSDASMGAIGLDYLMGENTTLYLAYARTNNDKNTNFQVSGKGHGNAVPIINGSHPAVISVGLVYKFNTNIYNN